VNADSLSKTTVHPLRARLKSETRATILHAAESVFADQGFHGAHMQEIASRAGIAVGTLYNYFEDRQHLLGALIDGYGAELDKDLARVLRGKMAFRKRLESFFDVVLRHIEERWQVFAILIEDELARGRGGSGKSDNRPALREVYHAAEKLFQIGLKEGAVRGDARDIYAALLVGTVRALFTHQLYVDRGAPLRARVPQLVRFFLDGAGTRGDAP
jgi:AcrR family transcriptional regulator